MAISARTPGGICARSSSSAPIAPVWRNSWIFSAMDVPTLGMAWSCLTSKPAMSAGYPPTARAAFSYDLGLNRSSDRIDRRSAYSRRAASTASFARGMLLAILPGAGSGYTEEPEQQRLLRVHPVLGLIPHRGVGSVDDLVGDLLPPMGRQAVKDGDVGGREAPPSVRSAGTPGTLAPARRPRPPVPCWPTRPCTARRPPGTRPRGREGPRPRRRSAPRSRGPDARPGGWARSREGWPPGSASRSSRSRAAANGSRCCRRPGTRGSDP